MEMGTRLIDTRASEVDESQSEGQSSWFLIFRPRKTMWIK